LISFIQQYDPKFLALKRSLKTFLAILISLAIFYDNPRMAMFAAITSLLISKSQTGITLKDRKFSLLSTGILLALLSVPVSIISPHASLSLIFIFVAAFVTFFLIGLRVVPDFPAIVVLSVMVVEMAFSHSVSSGIQFAGLFLLSTALVFTIHFIVLPTRPKVRLKTQLEMILKSLENYFEDVSADYPNLESGIAATQISAARARKAISEYKRLWQLLGLKSDNMVQSHSRFPEIAHGLEELFEYILLIWQFRARTWNSEKFKEFILLNKEFKSVIRQLMYHYHPDLLKPSDNEKAKIQNKLQELNKKYLTVYREEKDANVAKEWVAIFNTLHSLLALTGSMDATIREAKTAKETTIGIRLKGFLEGLGQSIGKIRFSNPAFRFGLRSAIIVGAAMAYFVFFEPLHGFWLVLFSILLIRPNLGVSIKAGRDRLIGTLVGCLAGFAIVSFVPAGTLAFYIIIMLSVFFMIWFTNLDKFILMIAALTILIITLFSLIYPSEGGIAWLRLAYTAAIVIFVIFISFLLWPEKARKKFALALADTIENEKQYFLSIIGILLNNSFGKDVEKRKNNLAHQLTNLDEIIDATKNEILQVKVIHHGINIHSYIYRLRNTLHSLEFSSMACSRETRFPELENELQNFANHSEEAFNSLIKALQTLERASGFPNLREDFLKVRDSFRAIRGVPDPEKDEITQLWNISTFIWNLKPLILELEGIKAEIELKMDES
jgi:uncharacterized membrane protein YccC